ncbi:integrase [Janthinobacterium sp. SUN176]|uniref:integrase n=1 Tax=Janthinobacterium sp. SUN176 TaxID=3014788 RepID=UPI0027144100|nr:integrase [Janthinobacterium sp. SUN176]MDO8074759.1 integrase [Janthinobacterium sp. SUN176]
MSENIFHFTPKAELTPQANLEAFIDVCRKSEVLNAFRQFEANVWDIGHLKGQNKMHRAVFSTMEAACENSQEPCLPQPFLNFSKSILVYLHDRRPVISQAPRISALRYLEAALREWSKGPRPTAVNVEVLDTAVELARNGVSAGVAYRIAGQLELIAELMHTKGLISLRQKWLHGMTKPQELGSRISAAALNARQEKLPSAAALRALAGIFQEAIKPADVLVSSYAAIMACAPERINEVLRLKRNCIIKGDGRFLASVGLRWAGSKGADDTVKWLPTEMVPVAEQAIAQLLDITAPAQELAAWYTQNPTKLYLHQAAVHLRDNAVLTLAEIGLILWGDEMARTSANVWAQQTNKLKKVSLGGRNIGFRYKDVEAAILSMLPPCFPHMLGAPNLLCNEAIAVARVNEMHATRATYLCMFTCVDYSSITTLLSRHSGNPSIFDRFSYTEDDGSPIEMNTHSLRHYLNMLAQMGGMSSAEIAIFSGRKDASQNRAYDHMTSNQVQEPISRALKTGMTVGLVEKVPRSLICRNDFPLAKPLAAHSTEYGWCRHDFASEPCQIYRDCINCEEQDCIKGDEHKERNLRSLKSETVLLLSVAKDALSEQEYGADTWVAHQTKTLERTNALLKILEDPTIPAGARVRLNVTNAALIVDEGNRPIYLTTSAH